LIFCKICNNEFKNSGCFINHLRSHKIRNKQDLKKYYDNYLKKENEDLCNLNECYNICKFLGIMKGYVKCCCQSHQTKLQMKKNNHMTGKNFPASKDMILNWKNNKKIKEEKRKNDQKNKDKIINDALEGIFNFDNKINVLNTCIFCGFKSNNGNQGVCFHVFKKHGLNKNSYKNLFLYKRKSFINLCENCGFEIASENKYNFCIKCLGFTRREVWNNYSEEKKNLIFKKIGKGNIGKKHPHSEQTKVKISLGSVYNDPKKSATLKEKQSRIMTEKILNHEFNPHSSYKNGYILLNKCDKKIFYRSSIEKIILENLDFLEWCDKIIYEPLKCKYNVIEKNISYCRYTIPDLLLKKDSDNFLSEIKPFEFLENPNGCWDKFLIEKLKSMIEYSLKNNLNNPIILTIKKLEIYFIDMIQYIKEIDKSGCTTIEELFFENNKNKNTFY